MIELVLTVFVGFVLLLSALLLSLAACFAALGLSQRYRVQTLHAEVALLSLAKMATNNNLDEEFNEIAKQYNFRLDERLEAED